MFNKVRVRHHAVVGPLKVHREERHFVIAAVAVAVIGAGISAYAQSQQAAAQRHAAKLTEEFRTQEAQSAQDSAAFQERQFRRRLALTIGKQEAVYGAMGIDMTSGSPFLNILDTAKQGEMEALNIRRGGDVAAADRLFAARMAKLQGSMVPSDLAIGIGAGVKASGSILSGMAGYGGGGGGGDASFSTSGGYQSYRAGERASY
jgi:hypothetical protein